jgi:hypothetical protein
MSYCTAKRMGATRQVQLLEKSLQQLVQQGATAAQIEEVRTRLHDAQVELATVGDCGD